MYRRIVVPLDGSTFAEAALPLALALSRKTTATLHLVTVVEPTPTLMSAEFESAAREGQDEYSSSVSKRFYELLLEARVHERDWSEEYLPSLVERISGQAGGEVTTALRTGSAVETLLAEAQAREADVVVMATHGHGALSWAWLGSVTDGFLRRAATPVILIRPEDGEAATTKSLDGFETLLIPLDGSELSERALEHATEFGELFGSAYHLTRVVAYPFDIGSRYLPDTVQVNQHILADAKSDAAGYLEVHAYRMRRHGLRVTTSVAVDPQPGHGILTEAEAVGSDAIAMATHGWTGIRRTVLGSAADKVVRAARVPLLLYRPDSIKGC